MVPTRLTHEEINSWQSLVTLEEKYSLNPHREEWIYRGQPKPEPLKSTLDRAFQDLGVTEDKRPMTECRLLDDFRRSCHLYAPTAVPNDDDIMAWFALMRHYGTPTRMVDFTYSMFIAAYFALELSKAEPLSGEEPIIRAINRTWLSAYLKEHVFERVKHPLIRKELEDSWCDPCDHKLFKRLFIERKADDELIKDRNSQDTDFAAVLNTFRTNDRIRVQQGLFVTATNITKPLYEVLQLMPGYSENVVKIPIAPVGAHDILKRLYRAGVNRGSLFPGLQGFAESLRLKILTYGEVEKVRDSDQNWRTTCTAY